jgi:DNA modification methylase
METTTHMLGVPPKSSGAATNPCVIANTSPVSRRARAGARVETGNQRPWPADKVERWPISRLIPYARNARTHSDEQVAQIAASIREFGFTVPVLVDEQGTLIAGHGRVLAAHQLGITDVPTMVARGWTQAQIQAYRIADNQLALNAGWDPELLRLELGELKLGGFDLSLTGFGDLELKDLLAERTEGLTDPDDAPAAPEHPVSQTGDLWLLGAKGDVPELPQGDAAGVGEQAVSMACACEHCGHEFQAEPEGGHRLLCGDATSADDVARLMSGEEADICFTSPPYTQQRDYKTGPQDWDALMQGVFSILPVRHEAQVLVNLGLVHRDGEWSPYWDGLIEWMRSTGWRRFGWYVWDQGPGLPGDRNGRLAPSHEFIFHFNRIAERARKTKDSAMAGLAVGGRGLRAKDGRISRKTNEGGVYHATKIPDSVIRVMRHKGGLGDAGSHPAVFPVDLASEMLTAFSDIGDVAFEPFCGSGTSILAAEKNGRTGYAMDLSPAYCDVAAKRWSKFTGRAVVFADDGRTFEQLAEAAACRHDRRSRMLLPRVRR